MYICGSGVRENLSLTSLSEWKKLSLQATRVGDREGGPSEAQAYLGSFLPSLTLSTLGTLVIEGIVVTIKDGSQEGNLVSHNSSFAT